MEIASYNIIHKILKALNNKFGGIFFDLEKPVLPNDKLPQNSISNGVPSNMVYRKDQYLDPYFFFYCM